MKRLVVLVAVTVMVAGSSLFLARPADAKRNCLSTLSGRGAGDLCIAQCLANVAQTCAASASTPDCALMISTQVQVLVALPLGGACDAAIAGTRQFCTDTGVPACQ